MSAPVRAGTRRATTIVRARAAAPADRPHRQPHRRRKIDAEAIEHHRDVIEARDAEVRRVRQCAHHGNFLGRHVVRVRVQERHREHHRDTARQGQAKGWEGCREQQQRHQRQRLQCQCQAKPQRRLAPALLSGIGGAEKHPSGHRHRGLAALHVHTGAGQHQQKDGCQRHAGVGRAHQPHKAEHPPQEERDREDAPCQIVQRLAESSERGEDQRARREIDKGPHPRSVQRFSRPPVCRRVAIHVEDPPSRVAPQDDRGPEQQPRPQQRGQTRDKPRTRQTARTACPPPARSRNAVPGAASRTGPRSSECWSLILGYDSRRCALSPSSSWPAAGSSGRPASDMPGPAIRDCPWFRHAKPCARRAILGSSPKTAVTVVCGRRVEYVNLLSS